MENSAHRIHEALEVVGKLRSQRESNSELARASLQVKRLQAQRFRATYADLSQKPRYRRAAAFFLHELYGDKDYAARDQQFSRIATTIAKLFPQAVVDTAAALAEVHALTETLDDEMARNWLSDESGASRDNDLARYIQCWRCQRDPVARFRQLEVVIDLGRELDQLTRTRGLRTLLKMMRHPATLGGLTSLQHFLETGFDAFAEMHGADAFLGIITTRESAWIQALSDEDAASCEIKLAHLLAAQGTQR